MKGLVAVLVAGGLALAPLSAKAEPSELRIPLGAGGFGFLPLHMMKKYELIEKKAAEAGAQAHGQLGQYRRPLGDERRAAVRLRRFHLGRPAGLPHRCGTARGQRRTSRAWPR